MKKTFLFALVISILLLEILLLTSCGRKPSSGKVTIRWAIWAESSQLKFYQKMAQEFEKAQPRIKVELQTFPQAQYDTKIFTAIAGNNAPDVITGGPMQGNPLIAKGAIRPLNLFLEKEEKNFLDDFFPIALESCRFKENLYALPKGISTIVLYYNKNQFDKAGVKYPDESWTWKEFLNTCMKLTQREKYPPQFAIKIENWYTIWKIFIYQNGGKIFDRLDNPTKCLIDQPESVEAIQYFVDLLLKYKISPSLAQIEKGGGYEFPTGREAMEWSWVGSVPVYRDTVKNFQWDIAPMPTGKKRATSLLILTYSLSAQSQHPQESWEFVKFLTGPEGQKINAESGQEIPSRRSIAYSDLFLKSDRPPKHMKNAVDAIEYGIRDPISEKMNQVIDIMVSEMDWAFMGKKSVKQVCQTIREKVDKVLQEK